MHRIKEPINGFTHLFGAAATIPLTVLLIYNSAKHATAWHVVSFAIFGAALFLLYTASAVYHLLPVSGKWTVVLRRIDHMMIFALIAGTYTPICLIPLRDSLGWVLLILVWSIALAGIVLKAVWLDAPRWLSTGLYVFMGWIVVFASYPLARAISPEALTYLFAGGVTYTVGALIYGLKWPPLKSKVFGFHEIFHLFVIGGSAFHVLFMFRLI